MPRECAAAAACRAGELSSDTCMWQLWPMSFAEDKRGPSKDLVRKDLSVLQNNNDGLRSGISP